MERKSLIRGSLILFCFIKSCLTAWDIYAQEFEEVAIKVTSLTPSIYMLEGKGGNIGVCIGEDATILIDDQYAPLTHKIKVAISKLTDKPVAFVINTHWHYDHTDGNENFGGEGAVIVSHKNSRKRMTSDQFIAMFDKKQEAYAAEGIPKITFAESMTFHINGETMNVFHLGSAHTDGDAIIHFATSNVFHTGDVFVRYGFPFIDEPNGGNIDGMINAVDYIAELSNETTQIIPGHGQLSNKQDLLVFSHMLKTIRQRVKNGIDAGKSFDEIKGSGPTAGFEERGIPKDGFIKIIYDNLTKSDQ